MYAKRKEPSLLALCNTGDLPQLHSDKTGKACAQGAPTQAQRLTRSVLRLACALSPRVFGPPIFAPWQLHALQRDPQKQHLAGLSTWHLPPQPAPRPAQRATRSRGTCGLRKLGNSKKDQRFAARPMTHRSNTLRAEEYVDAVYMALAAAAHARQTQQDQVDGVYASAACASLGNSTRSVVRPPCGR